MKKKFALIVGFTYYPSPGWQGYVGDFKTIKEACAEGKKKLENVPVGPDGIGTDPLEAGKVVTKELMNKGIELHSFLFCQREKSTRFLRLFASATLRYTDVYLYSLWPI